MGCYTGKVERATEWDAKVGRVTKWYEKVTERGATK